MEIRKEQSLTFDDVLLEPGYAGFFYSDVDMSTKLTRNIDLEIPLVSSPMDTVTDSRLAIMLGKLGGIGIIHRNLTVDDQAYQVELVRKEDQLIGAAVGSKPGYEKRVDALVSAGVDVIVVDAAHGHSLGVVEAVKTIRKNTNVDIIAGNVATAAGAKALVKAGADAVRTGMGPGAICTTRVISGMGVPQLRAINETVKGSRPNAFLRFLQKEGVPVIADGGISQSGDITKALAAGAYTVMLGGLFARTIESCGETVTLTRAEVPDRFKSIINGKEEYEFKKYRGMGSLGAMQTGIEVSSEDEYHGKDYKKDVLIAEGVEGLVPCSGPLKDVVDQLTGGLRSGMYDTGCRTIKELHKKAVFAPITEASRIESHPHDLFVTNAGGNYR